MTFVDEAKIYVQSGKGGDGMVTFRREKYVPRGGPSGGDGGKGGDVIFVANPKINTLYQFNHKARFLAEKGRPGGSSNKTGASGRDMVIEVPLGTIIRDAETGKVYADLSTPEQRIVLLTGGRGGRGNARFATSRNQAPNMAEKGEPGQELWLKLELKLLADVGLVGMPNVGKSTLLSVISNARPKIADYPFTTLSPNLGVVTMEYRDFVAADIPGLIEGASQGAGLGHAFLRHIQRTRLLVHLVDGTAKNPVADFNQINAELSIFDERLKERPQIVVVNKLDLPEAQEQWPALEQKFTALGYEVLGISAATQQNTRKLVQRMFQKLDELPDRVQVLEESEVPTYEISEDVVFHVEKLEDGLFRVTGKQIERAVKMTYWELDEAVARFQRILETLGISEALEKQGVRVGDTVIIGDTELEWGE
ncbi:MAG: GTPase ObgE [Anaerolineae bacterium]|nr:GTPase ObgE [Anaerolineae bacterium]